eukprot:TRINITY_DN10020_c0_g1_i1.p1 TRINITY_DN10020_c0_g1~~TRINITY_DN10020_c0_g1_i1.p1  ORF type:complete len:505 (-),score=78.48 TRINITY_DN10020_c0_g1_i1:54-1505(-)
MITRLIIAILVLGHIGVACAEEDQKTMAEVHDHLMKAVGKTQGNFLVARTMQSAVIAFRVLLSNMKHIQDNMVLDGNGQATLERVNKMMVDSIELKVRFEAAVSQLLAGMMAIDGHVQYLMEGASYGTYYEARKELSLDESKQRIQTVKNLLDRVTPVCDEYFDFLKDWSGANVLAEMSDKVDEIDRNIKNAETELEALAQKVLQAETEEAANAARAVEASQMLRWVKKQEGSTEDERQWAKIMQFAKVTLDAASTSIDIITGPISLLIFKSGRELTPVPKKTKADALSAAESITEITKYTRNLKEAKSQQEVLAEKVKHAKEKARTAEAKLQKLEQERTEFDSQLEGYIGKPGAFSANNVKNITDAISSFFYQRHNLMAISTPLKSFDLFIESWHDHWQMYDGRMPDQKNIYLKTILSHPMSWGLVAPEIWSTVQVFLPLLDSTTDPFFMPPTKVNTWRESMKAVWEARAGLREGRSKHNEL